MGEQYERARQALAVVQRLLKDVGVGLLAEHLEPQSLAEEVKDRLKEALEAYP